MHFLIIEDHALIFDALVMHLSTKFDGARFSYEPDWAIGHVAKYMPLDCVIFDLNLGDGERYDAIRSIHADFPNLPIIVLSGTSDPHAAKCAKAHGAIAYLQKGAVSDQISGLVELVVKQRLQIFPTEVEPGQCVSRALSVEPAQDVLTSREGDVLQCLLQRGGSNKAIGKELGIGENTVKSHLRSAYAKIGVTNRAQAIVCLKGQRSPTPIQGP